MRNWAIFGVSKLGEGPWRPGKKVWSVAIFGGSEVDFSQVELEEGVTQVVAVSIFGVNKVFVPRGTPIELSGTSILGVRSVKRSRTPAISNKEIHLNATTILGTFEVTERPG